MCNPLLNHAALKTASFTRTAYLNMALRGAEKFNIIQYVRFKVEGKATWDIRNLVI